MQATPITTALAGSLAGDRVGQARARRRAWAPVHVDPEEVTIRVAREDDVAALARLAQLDGGRADLSGEVLVAESAGSLLAARGVRGGGTLSDPFRAGAEVVALLDVRAAQLMRQRRQRRRVARRAMPVLRVGGAR